MVTVTHASLRHLFTVMSRSNLALSPNFWLWYIEKIKTKSKNKIRHICHSHNCVHHLNLEYDVHVTFACVDRSTVLGLRLTTQSPRGTDTYETWDALGRLRCTRKKKYKYNFQQSWAARIPGSSGILRKLRTPGRAQDSWATRIPEWCQGSCLSRSPDLRMSTAFRFT